MSWKERAKRIKNLTKQRKSEEAIKEKERKKEREKENRLFNKYRRPVEKICKRFASSLGVKLEKKKIHYLDLVRDWKFSIHWSGSYITVGVDERGIFIESSSQFTSDLLLSKCEDKEHRTLMTSTGYYRKSSSYGWDVGYRIPFDSFTKDKLAMVMEEFCEDITSRNLEKTQEIRKLFGQD